LTDEQEGLALVAVAFIVGFICGAVLLVVLQ
jgi:uncharacterized membrane protein YciS (DUF1049 family)